MLLVIVIMRRGSLGRGGVSGSLILGLDLVDLGSEIVLVLFVGGYGLLPGSSRHWRVVESLLKGFPAQKRLPVAHPLAFLV